MTAIQQFIEDAMKGGWNEREWFEKETQISHALFLETSVWQAVGKARGWEGADEIQNSKKEWFINWHCFITHLADGKSIEEALSIISE